MLHNAWSCWSLKFSVNCTVIVLFMIKSLCNGCSSPGSQFYSGWDDGGGGGGGGERKN